MGYGAYMNVLNSTSNSITTLINDTQCMYEGGKEGSDLQLFNNANIPVGHTLPGGKGQYIEAKASGTCFASSSFFTLQVENGPAVKFTESLNNYSATSVPGMSVNIDNSGEQATISVTVYTPGSPEGAQFEAALGSST